MCSTHLHIHIVCIVLTAVSTDRAASGNGPSLEDRLKTKINVGFNGAPLERVLDYVATAIQAPSSLELDRVAIKSTGVSLQTPVNLRLSRMISAKSTFLLVLTPLRLGYYLKEDRIVITSEREVANLPSWHHYPVSKWRDATAEEGHRLEAQIERMVEPNSWDTADGAGRIRVKPDGDLVIWSVASIHEMVDDFLFELRSEAEHKRTFKTHTVGDTTSGESPKELTNSIGMPFKLIPAGAFTMGHSESRSWPSTNPNFQINEFPDEYPRHKVRLANPFYLGVTEVTQEQYEKVMVENPSGFSTDGKSADRVKELDTSCLPVEMVSWDDAAKFCKALSAKEGRMYRLPTEAEWEYACRAGNITYCYCFADDAAQLCEYAWFQDSSDWRTHSVGQKSSNAWGLYDMHGNVSEWCSDWYDRKYYANSQTDDPRGPDRGLSRVSRGGCYDSLAKNCRSATRFRDQPSVRLSRLGFRVVLEVSSKTSENGHQKAGQEHARTNISPQP